MKNYVQICNSNPDTKWIDAETWRSYLLVAEVLGVTEAVRQKFNAVIKNKKTDIIYIHDEDDIIGYIHFIKINENKFNKMINQKEYTDVHRDEMKKFIKKKSNYLNINSISIRLTYQNKKTVALVSKFIKEYVVRKNRMGYSIKGIVGVANSEFENAVYKSMKMKCDTEEQNDFYVYYLKDDKLKEYLG